MTEIAISVDGHVVYMAKAKKTDDENVYGNIYEVYIPTEGGEYRKTKFKIRHNAKDGAIALASKLIGLGRIVNDSFNFEEAIT